MLVAGGLALAGIALVLVSGGSTADDERGRARPGGAVAAAVVAATRAGEPFPGLTETSIRVGDRALSVVLADETGERYQGLREREDLGPYDGMLFVFDGPTFTGFTMSTVPVPLDIGFYDADGQVVDRLRMKPCPSGENCPGYRPEGSFTYALETLAGDLPQGRLAAG